MAMLCRWVPAFTLSYSYLCQDCRKPVTIFLHNRGGDVMRQGAQYHFLFTDIKCDWKFRKRKVGRCVSCDEKLNRRQQGC